MEATKISRMLQKDVGIFGEHMSSALSDDKYDDGIIADDYEPDNDQALLDKTIREYCYNQHVDPDQCRSNLSDKANIVTNNNQSNRIVTNAITANLSDMLSDSFRADSVDGSRNLNDDQPNGNREVRSEFLTRLWRLPVPMPSEFDYTGVIMLNSFREGLLHTFLRHHNEWEQVITGLSTLRTEYMQTIQTRMDSILNASNETESNNRLTDLFIVLENPRNSNSSEIRAAMFRAQMKIYEYIRKNVTYRAYHGEGVNNSGLTQVYFNIPSNDGSQFITNRPFMNIAISMALFNPMSGSGDPRPVHSITTVYFMTANKVRNFYMEKTW